YGVISLERLGLENMTRSVRGTMETPGRNVKQKQGLNRSLQDESPRAACLLGLRQSARGWAHKCGS
ncbi:MAG: RNA-guided endonuclease TnpB family protein, partial [Acidimicrobiales bacterium]